MYLNIIVVCYLLAAVCFIQSLKGLSHPKSALRGNLFGISGMILAVVSTLGMIFLYQESSLAGFIRVAIGLGIGALIGSTLALRVEMTKMPELVAFMHSMIGLAAVCIAITLVLEPSALLTALSHGQTLPLANRIEVSIGAGVGAITFSGSIIAFGKLSGRFKFRLFQGAPLKFPGQHFLNLCVGILIIGLMILFSISEGDAPIHIFYMLLIFSFLLGVTLIIPIGGADMPVVVSMLNSYSGWAAAGIGFSLDNPLLIIAGALVGSSGAILSYIMCRAMNRSFISVILGGFGAEEETLSSHGSEQRIAKSGSSDDVAFIIANAGSVIIVPGYGLAVARAQHALVELADKLTNLGVDVRYAIHPVAGRMPGHMNVLLAEAEVPYDQVYEMEEINSEFSQTDVVLVLGANDVVNPLALVPGSPIHGMPILEAHKARTVIVNKRSMAAGYSGLDNELFYLDKTMMVFGDAKKVLESIVKSLES